MKVDYKRDVTVTLTLNEKEAEALAQLCVQVGGVQCMRRDFYHEVWQRVRGVLGDIPTSRGIFTFGDKAILCTGQETESEGVSLPEKP